MLSTQGGFPRRRSLGEAGKVQTQDINLKKIIVREGLKIVTMLYLREVCGVRIRQRDRDADLGRPQGSLPPA